VLLPVTSAVTAVLMDIWDPARALEVVEGERIAVMISTPMFMRTMIDDPTFEDADRSSLRLFSLGGAGVAPAMVREGARAFGCWCKRTYGSTEYPTLTTGRLGDNPERDATTDGCLIGRAELRIVDPETLIDVAPGAAGELLVRGPEMFVGYLDPGLDDEAFTPGGWFRTGDLAQFSGEHFRFRDRRDPSGARRDLVARQDAGQCRHEGVRRRRERPKPEAEDHSGLIPNSLMIGRIFWHRP
jgi:cyclohexanecarboxylate-CoA ligase